MSIRCYVVCEVTLFTTSQIGKRPLRGVFLAISVSLISNQDNFSTNTKTKLQLSFETSYGGIRCDGRESQDEDQRAVAGYTCRD